MRTPQREYDHNIERDYRAVINLQVCVAEEKVLGGPWHARVQDQNVLVDDECSSRDGRRLQENES